MTLNFKLNEQTNVLLVCVLRGLQNVFTKICIALKMIQLCERSYQGVVLPPQFRDVLQIGNPQVLLSCTEVESF